MRILFGRVGRTLLILLALAAAWGLWWVWPERPLRELRIPNLWVDFVSLSREDCAVYAIAGASGRGVEISQALLRLPNGEDILPRVELAGTPFFLQNQRLLLIGPNDEKLRLIDLAAGQILWKLDQKTGWRRWSQDGRIVIVELVDGKGEIVLYDTSAAAGLPVSLSNATKPFCVDDAGHTLVSKVEDDPTAIALWNPNDGKELKRLQSPGRGPVRGLALSPDGKMIVTTVKSENVNNSFSHEFVLWNLEKGTPTNFDSMQIADRPLLVHAAFDASSRFVSIAKKGYPVWDTRSDLPRLMANFGRLPNFDPSGNRYLVQVTKEGSDPFSGAGTWMLFESDTQNEIARGTYDKHQTELLRSLLSSDKWFAVQRERDWSDFDRWCNRLLGRPLSADKWFDVISLATGSLTNRIRAEWDDRIAGFTRNNTIWIHNQNYDESSDTWSLILREWPTTVTKPYWLWFVTALGLGIVVVDLKYSRRAIPN